jgi:YggT family protein
MTSLKHAAVFIIQTLFNLYLFILLMRLVFQYFRVDFYNPLTQFIVKLTSPLVVPLRRIIPGYFGIDFATVILIFALTYLKLFLLSMVALGFPNMLGLVVATFGDILSMTLNFFFYAIIAYILFNWLAPMTHSPIRTILHQISEPLLRPFRKKIPSISGFDISPLFVLMCLQLLNILIADPLVRLAV